jgi:hypothetical protein
MHSRCRTCRSSFGTTPDKEVVLDAEGQRRLRAAIQRGATDAIGTVRCLAILRYLLATDAAERASIDTPESRRATAALAQYSDEQQAACLR